MHRARVLCAALVAAFALSTAAAAERFPARYVVSGVAADDVLNVRIATSLKSDVIGQLAPGAQVEVIGVGPQAKWARVRAGERMGWAALRYLARAPRQGIADAPGPLVCAGTEPFWSLSHDGTGTATFRHAGLGLTEEIALGTLQASAGSPQVFGALGRSKGGVTSVSVSYAACTDGMSDLAYGLSAIVISENGLVSTGCCSLR